MACWILGSDRWILGSARWILGSAQWITGSAHTALLDTLHALLDATENIYKSVDLKLFTVGIFIDFSRAFDVINHDILLKKLSHYGISGQLLKLIECYLADRKQYVSYGGKESVQLSINCGVPQGSVLGPLLFIIFVNDIVSISNLAMFVLFADDLNLFVAHSCRKSAYEIANQI